MQLEQKNYFFQFKFARLCTRKSKGPDQVDYRSDKPLIFLPSQGISDEVRCQFYCFLDADFKFQVEFLKFPLFLSDFQEKRFTQVQSIIDYIYMDSKVIIGTFPVQTLPQKVSLVILYALGLSSFKPDHVEYLWDAPQPVRMKIFAVNLVQKSYILYRTIVSVSLYTQGKRFS